jgi:hypothetical protein
MAKRRLKPPGTLVPACEAQLELRRERALSPALAAAWRAALDVSEAEIAGHIPTELDAAVAEALLAGHLTTEKIAESLGRPQTEVAALISSPVAMAWISRAMYQVLNHRLALVDAAMFTRAVSGDVSAAKLVYERVRALDNAKRVDVHYSGGVNFSAMTTEDLERILHDKERTIPTEFKVLESRPTEALSGA